MDEACFSRCLIRMGCLPNVAFGSINSGKMGAGHIFKRGLSPFFSLWRLGLKYWRRCTEFGGSGDRETLEKALRDEVHHQAQSLE